MVKSITVIVLKCTGASFKIKVTNTHQIFITLFRIYINVILNLVHKATEGYMSKVSQAVTISHIY